MHRTNSTNFFFKFPSNTLLFTCSFCRGIMRCKSRPFSFFKIRHHSPPFGVLLRLALKFLLFYTKKIVKKFSGFFIFQNLIRCLQLLKIGGGVRVIGSFVWMQFQSL
ncbi:hypothetical protein HanXRQr2_Chr10g0438601 [Helianthus annuus]|uniref:Uncharacterized protein n=1 Tax=Helianthus annuus TaxID=4232 RepID=A0A9K3HXL1_HELAN|nr:hypothetical protein HanXRQr2_Chr10g0438601 [Helianthus annuus]KAJ0883615.1 hypothetical protein HanPSC8_Chr10g0423631 [Helianthus annuus]